MDVTTIARKDAELAVKESAPTIVSGHAQSLARQAVEAAKEHVREHVKEVANILTVNV